MATGPNDYALFINTCSFELAVVAMKGKEGLSKLFSFDVTITCNGDLRAPAAGGAADDPPQLLRQRALLRMPFAGGVRLVRGMVSAITPVGRAVIDRHAPQQMWQVRIVPLLWLSKHRVRSRIFQNLTVPQIVTTILSGQDYGMLGLRLRANLTQDHEPREYCMQYRESDYAFIRRILSEEGIFWYFDHGTAETTTAGARFVHDATRTNWTTVDFDPTSNAEEMVLLDDVLYPPVILDPSSGVTDPATFRLREMAIGAIRPDVLGSFQVKHAIKPNAVLLRDYNYERPHLNVTAAAPTFDGLAARPTGSLVAGDDDVEKWHTWVSKSRGETTDNQGLYDAVQAGRVSGASTDADADLDAAVQLRIYEHSSPLGPDRVDEQQAQVRLDAISGKQTLATGRGYCPLLVPGFRFSLANDLQAVVAVEGDYVVTRVRHNGDAAGSDIATYECHIECVPAGVRYRPKQRPKRRREVIESATVVGPAGHEIHTDKLGRVRIQFHWDMLGSMDDTSSCWVRVLQPWSGTAYGTQFIPRVGTEVMVSFAEGDHDRPLVIGSVYNGVQPFPFLPPEGETKSGFRTQSTPGGNGYNELSFDDRAGNERVILRAQADLDTYVGRDRATRVEGSELKRIEGKRTERVTEDIDRWVGGDQKVKIEGARSDFVEGMSESKISEDSYSEIGGAQRHFIKRTGLLHAKDDLTTRSEGNHATVVGSHLQQRSFALHVEGGSQLSSSDITEIVSPKGLRLRCGTSIIELMEDQILITADKVMLHAPGVQTELRKEGEFWVDADQHATIKSETIKLRGQESMLKLSTKAELMGPKISLCKPESADGLDELERKLTTIELKDVQGRPCPQQRYILVFADGREQSGFLDETGRAELLLEEGAAIRFPGMIDVAKGAAQ